MAPPVAADSGESCADKTAESGIAEQVDERVDAVALGTRLRDLVATRGAATSERGSSGTWPERLAAISREVRAKHERCRPKHAMQVRVPTEMRCTEKGGRGRLQRATGIRFGSHSRMSLDRIGVLRISSRVPPWRLFGLILCAGGVARLRLESQPPRKSVATWRGTAA